MYYGICKKPGLNSSGEVEWLPQEALSGSWGELMTSTSMVVAAKWADVLANANPTTPLNFPDELWQLVSMQELGPLTLALPGNGFGLHASCCRSTMHSEHLLSLL
jgi:hypothetical protein